MHLFCATWGSIIGWQYPYGLCFWSTRPTSQVTLYGSRAAFDQMSTEADTLQEILSKMVLHLQTSELAASTRPARNPDTGPLSYALAAP